MTVENIEVTSEAGDEFVDMSVVCDIAEVGPGVFVTDVTLISVLAIIGVSEVTAGVLVPVDWWLIMFTVTVEDEESAKINK